MDQYINNKLTETHIQSMKNSLSLKHMAEALGYDYKTFSDVLAESTEASISITADTVKSNKDVIVNVQPMEADGVTYYVVFVPYEPIDFEHWTSVEELFKNYDYTANWVGEDNQRPKSEHIRWVEDIDDEVPSLYQQHVYDNVDQLLSDVNLKRKII